MREESQFYNICDIINNYSGNEPLSRHLKVYFRAHHYMGSKDRKEAASFIYNYFRIGKAIPERSQGERISVGNYLCADLASPLLLYCMAKFLKAIAAEPGPTVQDSQIGLKEKMDEIHAIYPEFKTDDIFPYAKHLSDYIKKDSFIHSLLKQPKLWIRVQKKFIKEVTDELTKENISFEISLENRFTFSFANSTKLDKLTSYEKGYFEIQDWSSQQTINYFQPKPNEHWWDACAGSGGKSLLLHDAEPSVHLTVSDSRGSILNNLKERFRKAQIRSYETMQADLTISNFEFRNSKLFDGVIADVPCTGSGTWGRTPEWLSMFKTQSIVNYSELQKKIVRNIIPYLKPNAPLIYITCSVFKEENEDVVGWIKDEFKLDLVESSYIKGYDRGGDTMFVARMVKK